MDLSIVIPALNENKKIPQDVRSATDFLLKNNLTGEIIVVDDGSTDNTADVAESVEMPHNVPLRVIRSEVNRGKGHAVRIGIKITRGDYVMFADSGNCVPYEDALRGLDMLRNGECEIAHGSRKMTGTHILKSQNIYRRICSRFFHW
ncbi:MAG: glycosyltransferase, partial [Sedimentisphaerales bacterium]|nr:glycosyltransferase [Sedimentisphaerales bacterium]